MDKKLTAILLKATDSKENDKRIELFSAEEGLVMATMRGVKKANAKLKFACQPFAFCIYELTVKNGNYSVTGATSIEDMFPLTRNTDKYVCACAVIETIRAVHSAVDSSELFLIVLKTFKALLYTKTNPYVALAKLVQKIISMTGFDKKIAPYDGGHIETPAQLLSFISTKYLDELELIGVDESIAKSASVVELRRVEKLFETKINSIKFIASLQSGVTDEDDSE